ncbi:MAG: ribose 5-phosphate isomerase B [Candidatus Kapabacteria bacterium]|nr:ribose 5-phosphate isomerase B [Candidatus Kapabacteria bacterium]MDW8011937.1 ribose 5-phosphate isomerase B [Bacteroidota bacterium]
MRIAIASDHAGFAYKERLRELLQQAGNEVQDYGAHSEESSDYPDFAVLAARAVARGEADYGILICGSGIGMSIVANKVPGVRAANCCTEEMARLSRLHNNANVLTFGARLMPFEQAWRIVQVFLETPFEGGRHERRVGKIHQLTER